MMAGDRTSPVGAWQWDGTREGGRSIAVATGQCVRVLHEYGDAERRPQFLELPPGSPISSLVEPGSWVVRTADGVLHEVTPALFEAIRETALADFAEVEGVPV
jgi:hypothetical protein